MLHNIFTTLVERYILIIIACLAWKTHFLKNAIVKRTLLASNKTIVNYEVKLVYYILQQKYIVVSIHFPSYFKQLSEVNLKYNFSKATFLQNMRAVYAEFFSKCNVIKQGTST